MMFDKQGPRETINLRKKIGLNKYNICKSKTGQEELLVYIS